MKSVRAKTDYLRVSILVFVFLVVGIYLDDTRTASVVCSLYIGTCLILDLLEYLVHRRK